MESVKQTDREIYQFCTKKDWTDEEIQRIRDLAKTFQITVGRKNPLILCNEIRQKLYPLPSGVKDIGDGYSSTGYCFEQDEYKLSVCFINPELKNKKWLLPVCGTTMDIVYDVAARRESRAVESKDLISLADFDKIYYNCQCISFTFLIAEAYPKQLFIYKRYITKNKFFTVKDIIQIILHFYNTPFTAEQSRDLESYVENPDQQLEYFEVGDEIRDQADKNREKILSTIIKKNFKTKKAKIENYLGPFVDLPDTTYRDFSNGILSKCGFLPNLVITSIDQYNKSQGYPEQSPLYVQYKTV
jgi:hypothetical protein